MRYADYSFADVESTAFCCYSFGPIAFALPQPAEWVARELLELGAANPHQQLFKFRPIDANMKDFEWTPEERLQDALWGVYQRSLSSSTGRRARTQTSES